MPQHGVSALNPFASSAEVKEIAAKAYSRGASSAQIKAEVDALVAAKKRTAELQELKAKRELHPHRRDLKSERAELKKLMTTVKGELTTLTTPQPDSSAPPQHYRARVHPQQLQLKPNILDPQEIVPEEVQRRFREEYREMQRRKRAQEKAVSFLQEQEAEQRLQSLPSVEARSSLEEWRAQSGHAIAAPPAPTDLGERTHGVHRRAVFAQFGGSQTLPQEGGSPMGKRRTAPL